MKIILPTLRTFLLGVVVQGALLFPSAGTFDYWQAWVFIFVFSAATNALGVYLLVNDPELLERRKKVGPAAEGTPSQKIIITLIFLGFLSILVFCGFDRRFGWSSVPPLISLGGNALVVVGLFIDLLVLRVNRYAASSIQIERGQKVITTGPYAIVRHPMYAGALIMMIGVPPALGSYWGFTVVALILPILIWRILDEERVLKQELPGYYEHTQQVHHRLIPGLW